MSTPYDPLMAALLAAVTAAVPENVQVVADLDQTDLQALAQQASGTVVNVLFDAVEFDENKELGALHQPEHWTWEIEVLIPTMIGCTSIAWSLFVAIRAALCPAAGLRLAANCDFLNMSTFSNTGEIGGSRLYVATVTHDRDAG